MECWYGIMGMGAVCHTLNPRLTAEQIAWMLGQSEAEILVRQRRPFPSCFASGGAGERHPENSGT